MMKTRRDFVRDASKGVLAASVAPALALGDVLAATQTGTGLVRDPRYLEHRLPDRGGEPHPERPLRLVRIAEAFRASGVDRELTPLPLLADPLPFIRAHHAPDHVESVRRIAVTGKVSELAVAGALGPSTPSSGARSATPSAPSAPRGTTPTTPAARRASASTATRRSRPDTPSASTDSRRSSSSTGTTTTGTGPRTRSTVIRACSSSRRTTGTRTRAPATRRCVARATATD